MKINIKKILKLAVIPMALLVAAGCSAETEMTDIKVAEFRGINWMAAYVAEEKGYFDEENLNVEFVKYNDGPIAFQGMHNGDSQFTLLSQEPVLKAQNEGLKSNLVFAALRTRAYGFVTSPDIKDIKDLKGKAIFAGMPGSSPYSFVSSILKENGLDPERDVTFVNMEYGASMAALSKGQIQASYINTDNRLDIEKMNMDVNMVVDTLKSEDAKKYLKSEAFPGEIIVTTEKFAQENPESVQAFVNAVSKANDWIQANDSTEVAKALMTYYPGSTEEELAARVEVVRPLLSEDGYISEEGQQAVNDFSVNNGVISEPVPYEGYVNMTFVDNVEK